MMQILFDVANELFKMFVADLRMTLATVSGVALVAVLLQFDVLSPVAAAFGVLAICIAILISVVVAEAAKRAK